MGVKVEVSPLYGGSQPVNSLALLFYRGEFKATGRFAKKRCHGPYPCGLQVCDQSIRKTGRRDLGRSFHLTRKIVSNDFLLDGFAKGIGNQG